MWRRSQRCSAQRVGRRADGAQCDKTGVRPSQPSLALAYWQLLPPGPAPLWLPLACEAAAAIATSTAATEQSSKAIPSCLVPKLHTCLSIAHLRLAVGAGIAKVGQHSGDGAGRGALACVNLWSGRWRQARG